jgi:hypothetical protein
MEDDVDGLAALQDGFDLPTLSFHSPPFGFSFSILTAVTLYSGACT